ncbi:MAG TPA: PilZ domain-containing protein, partial [Thermoanaerobaculia bacterium]|nr:PilZ domain-containing protein [Thermoanaerobaculia bacterium]
EKDPAAPPPGEESLEGTLNFSIGAEVVNLSIAGMAVRIGSPLRVGNSYAFSIGGGGKRMDLEGVVRWCRLRRTRRQEDGDVEPVYEAGISFEGLLNQKGRALMAFIEENTVVDVEDRVFGRFSLRRPGQVAISSHGKFLIRRLSRSGLLIEMSDPPRRESHISLEIQTASGTLILEGRVASVVEGVAENLEPKFDVGIELDPVDSDMEPAFERLIADHPETRGGSEEVN